MISIYPCDFLNTVFRCSQFIAHINRMTLAYDAEAHKQYTALTAYSDKVDDDRKRAEEKVKNLEVELIAYKKISATMDRMIMEFKVGAVKYEDQIASLTRQLDDLKKTSSVQN